MPYILPLTFLFIFYLFSNLPGRRAASIENI